MKENVMTSATGGVFSGYTSNGRILVVDDVPDVRKITRMILTKAGYEVIEAEDGEQAIQVINEGENPLLVDAIITDIRMPKISGVEAIHYFQLRYPRVPIIVLTGYPDMDMATEFLKHGIVDYLIKPPENTMLLQAVAKALEQRALNRL
jgi:two-component system chemotaxis response regulator CheY